MKIDTDLNTCSVSDIHRQSPIVGLTQDVHNRHSKDISKFMGLKSEDLKMYKQKSAESDSDSLSLENLSLHSGSLSNTSSRNASPKTLRTTLKTPVMLQKVETKHLTPRQHLMKPVVKKVNRKAIQQIEKKLSEVTLKTVDEIISEHVKDKVLSVEDVSRLEEELKALLAISLYAEDEMSAAEELVGLKLHDLINRSFEIDEEGKAAGYNENTEKADAHIDSVNTTEVVEKTVVYSEIARNTQEQILKAGHVMNELIETSDNSVSGMSHFLDKCESSNDMGKESDAQTGESNTIVREDVEMKTRKFMTWKDIAGAKTGTDSENNDLLTNPDTFGTEGKEEVTCEETRQVADTLQTEEFERQYWGRNGNEESVSFAWGMENVNDAWGGEYNVETFESEVLEECDNMNDSMVVVENRDFENSDEKEIVENKSLGEKEFTWELNDSGKPQRKRKTRNAGSNSSLSTLRSSVSTQSCFSKTGTESSLELGDIKNSDSVDSLKNSEDDVPYCSMENNDSETLVFTEGDKIESEFASALNASLITEICTEIPDPETACLMDDPNDIIGNSEYASELVSTLASDDIVDANKSLRMLKEAYISSYNDLEDICTADCGDNTVGISDDRLEIGKEGSATGSEVFNGKACDGDKTVPGADRTDFKTEENMKANGVSSKNKKQSKRKAGGKTQKHVPFLKVEDKEKFKNTAWSSFPLLSSSNSSIGNNSEGKVGLPDLNCKETSTEVEYFKLVERLQSGGFVDSEVRYLTGKAWKLVKSEHELPVNGVADYIPETYKIDKSTCTDDFCPISDQEGLEFLQTCFPDVPSDELECVFENCDGNTEWTINLLLDWQYSLHFTEEEKLEFKNGLKKIQRCVSPEADKPEEKEDSLQPPSLLDMCFNKIEKEEIAPR